MWSLQLRAKASRKSVLHPSGVALLLLARRLGGRRMSPCQQGLGTILNKGCVSALLLSQCLDASRPWLCYWILHSLELLDEPIPQMVATEWVWLWGIPGVPWNWVLSSGVLFVQFLFYLFWMKNTRVLQRKYLPFSWPPVTSWNSSTSEAGCVLVGRIRLWTSKRRILFHLWPFLWALALVFEKSLHQRWRNLIFPESTVYIWIASVGMRVATQWTKMPLLSVNTRPEIPPHQCLGDGMALDGSGCVQMSGCRFPKLLIND